LLPNARDALEDRRQAEGTGSGWKAQVAVRAEAEGDGKWVRLSVGDRREARGPAGGGKPGG
jgi:hypothetical protein